MFAKSNLKAVSEIEGDEVDVARREVAQIQAKLDRKRAGLAEVEARLVRIEADIKASAMNDDRNVKLDELFKEKLLAVGAIDALRVVVAELEGQLAQAQDRDGEVRRRRMLAEARGKEPAARESVLAARLEIERAANAFIASVVKHAEAKAAHDEIRGTVAQSGRPVAAEEGTRAVLFSLGVGWGVGRRPGVEYQPFPIPAGLPFV